MIAALLSMIFAVEQAELERTQEIIGDKISINLMWIDKEFRSNAQLLVPENQLEFFNSSLDGWLKKTKDSTVLNFWFDSRQTPNEAIHFTKEYIRNKFGEKSTSRVHLRDILSLDTVQFNPEKFLAPLPVYYRADLLRFVVAKELLEKKEATAFIYADLNVQPETEEYIFDPKTIGLLGKYGFVMLRNDMGPNCHHSGGASGFENKFMICVNDLDFIIAADHALIQPNNFIIQAAAEYNQLKPCFDKNKVFLRFEQYVYNTIPGMFLYLQFLKGRIKLVLENGTQYDYNKYNFSAKAIYIDNYNCMWNPALYNPCKGELYSFLELAYLIISKTRASENAESVFILPTKSMTAPSSHFG